MQNNPTIYRGLEGIYVDTTSISYIDGEKGKLSYRGVGIEELVEESFIEVAWLLLFGKKANKIESRTLKDFIAKNSYLEDFETEMLRKIDKKTHPMKVLQGVTPLLRVEPKKSDFDKDLARGLSLISKIPIVLSTYYRLQMGKEVLRPKPFLGFHENFLYLFTGEVPDKDAVKVLDVTQILQMEHSFNASTFSSRVTASTLAPVESAISAAIGTLFGRLHGGADQAALEMALSIGFPDKAESFVLNALGKKEKIMGMGHRVYRVVDPRAKILKPMAKKLCKNTPFENLFLTLEKVEEIMGREMLKKGKQVKANIEFYKGPVFYALGIPPLYFTSLFAMSRSFGYLAHIRENNLDNKLIRPKAFYRND